MSLNIPDTFGVSKTPCSSWKLQALLWICYYYFWWYSILYLYLSIKIITCVGWVYHPVSIGGYSQKNPNWTSFSSAKKITVVLPFGISQVVVVGCNSIWICRKAAGKFREKHKKMGWKILVHPRKLTWIPKIAIFERRYVLKLKTSIFGIYVRSFGGVDLSNDMKDD